MQRRVAELSKNRQRSSLSKAFSSNNLKKGKNWDPRDILEELTSWIAKAGAPGVAEALISKLAAGGVDFSGSQMKQKSGILSRRKSVDTFVDRSKYLKLAVEGNQYDMLQILLPHADPNSIDQALAPAIRTGNVRVAELLLRYGACASQTPQGQDAFRQACVDQSRSHLVGLLLSSETQALPAWTSACMTDATRAACLETVLHLSRSTADGNHNHAEALKAAIALGRQDIALAIIMGNKPPQGSNINESFQLVQQNPSINPSTKLAMAELLLCAGAHGDVVSSALESACATQFYDMAILLSRYGASIEYKDAKALKTAIASGDLNLVSSLLVDSARLSPALASSCVPLVAKQTWKQAATSQATGRRQPASGKTRAMVLGLLLRKGANGVALDAALRDVLSEEDASQRDSALINMLLEHDADINYDQGSGLAGVIKQMDVKLLESLLKNASPQTAAARILDAMDVSDHRERFEIVSMLIDAGAVIGTQEIAKALSQTLTERPVDMSLLRLLLQKGGADVNLMDGSIIKKSVSNSDPKVLDVVFGHGKPSASSVTCAFNEMASLPCTDCKAWKLRTILSRCTQKEDLDWVLAREVQSVLQTGNDKASLSPLKILLDGGANPNAYKAAALCHAVIGANSKVTELLFEAKVRPTSASLGAALPHVLRIADSMERLTLTKKLVDAGAHSLEANRALVHAITTFPKDVSLQGVLAMAADTSDGEALSLSVSKESPETMDLLLVKSKSSVETRSALLGRAMGVRNRAARHRMCGSFLKLGVSQESASSALLVAARDGDVELGDLLIGHGASIATNDGQAVVEACRGGSAEVLAILLKQDGNVKKSTLESGFQAATEVRDLSKRALVFKCLLQKGVKGDLVDAQLQSAARYGEDGQALLRVLLAAGADPNFNNGECVIAATRSAFIGNLELLLGLWHEGGIQKRVAQPTLVRSLKACWNLSRDNRFKVMSGLIRAGLQVTEDLHRTLNEAVNEDDPEERLVRLLLDHGASPSANGCKTLVDAVNNSASSLLALLLERNLPQEDVNRAFKNAFTADTFNKWFTESGFKTATVLLEKGAHGDSLGDALILPMKRCTPETKDLAGRFVALLMSHGADVNYNSGEPLQQAASKANIPWTKQLLEGRPTIQTLSLAFQCIFDTAISQDEVLGLFKLFAEYRDGDVRIDILRNQQGSDPVLVRAISQYPRSVAILETLLDAGLYYDQAAMYKIHSDIDDAEDMNLLLWAVAQPQKRVSNAVIELLVTRGAKVNAESNLSHTTPLMLAVQTRRPDLVKLLLLQGAEVDVQDYLGRTPLFMATDIGGDTSVQMTSLLLAADPSRDDGSLHNAARDLNQAVVKILAQSGHDPDFPSPLHEGRSALAELCLHGSDNAEMGPDRERTMQKVMTFLIDSQSDLSIKSNDKSMLQLCFEAAEPIATTRCFLKSGMWKHINKPFNYHTANGYTYSPTMYIKKLLPQNDISASLLQILRSNRANDVYFALSGAQPDDAVGLPEDMAVQERVRKARLERLAEETQDFTMAMARKREIAAVEQKIIAQKAEMEDMRRRKLHNEDVAAVRSRGQLEESLASAAHARRMQEQHALADSSIGRTRALAAAELEAEEARRRKTLEWEAKLNTEKVENARALSSVRISERQEVERLDKDAEARLKGRMDAQRKLLESQEKLAKRLADGANGAVGVSDARRQIGYVTEF